MRSHRFLGRFITTFALVTIVSSAHAQGTDVSIASDPSQTPVLPPLPAPQTLVLPPLPTTRVHAAPGDRIEVQTQTGTVEVQCPTLAAPQASAPLPALVPAPAPVPTPASGNVAALAPTPAPTKTESYGGAMIISDVISGALMLGGLVKQSGGFFALGLGLYALGGPIVHVANGEPMHALGSLAMRVGVPFTGGYYGFNLGGGSDGCRYGCRDAMVLGGLGFFGGAVLASLLDGAVLAKHKVVNKVQATRFAPQVSVDATGAQAGVAGTF